MPKTLVVLLCVSFAGCATTRSAPSAADPWERVNRATYAFNDALDRAALKPLAKGYVRVVPGFVRTGVSNFVSNLSYPTTIVNDLLQLKLLDAVQDTTRLVLNTTFGLGGLFDPASKANLPRNDEDFGQTLGRWGMPAGPYIMLPLLGPSTLRDTPSKYVDYLTDGRHYVDDSNAKVALAGAAVINKRAGLLPAEEALTGAFDPYALIRNAYLDRREYRVRDGKVPDPDLSEDVWIDESPPQPRSE